MNSFFKTAKARWLHILTLFVLCLAIYFRYRYLGNYMTEYDDIGIIDLPLSLIGGNTVLQQPLAYANHIGLSWTYPPAQYLLVSMLWHGQTNPEIMHFIARICTATFSVLNVFLVGAIGYYLDDKKWSIRSLLITSLVALSFFQISYGYHAGPYQVMFTTVLIMILALYKYTQSSKKHILLIFVLASGLTYFNYLVALMMPGIVLAMFSSDIDFSFSLKRIWLNVKKRFIYYLIGSLSYLLLIQPILSTYLKSDRGMYGKWLWQDTNNGVLTTLAGWGKNFLSQNYNVLHNLTNFSYQLHWSAEYLLYGVLLILAAIGILYTLTQKTYRAIGISNICYLLIWLFLHTLKKVPFDETRHVIVLLPVYLISIHALLNRFSASRITKWFSTFMIGCVLITFSVTQNMFFTERASQFNYPLLKQKVIENNTKLVITDIYTLTPFQLPYEVKNTKVYMLDGMYKDQYNLPPTIVRDPRFSQNSVIYISQQKPVDERTSADMTKYGKFLEYKLEIPSNSIYFAPNNTPSNSVANGFYIYIYR